MSCIPLSHHMYVCYRTSPATSGEVNVEVNVEVNIEIAQNIKALTFEVWVGKEELTTDSNPTAQLFSVRVSSLCLLVMCQSFLIPTF